MIVCVVLRRAFPGDREATGIASVVNKHPSPTKEQQIREEIMAFIEVNVAEGTELADAKKPLLVVCNLVKAVTAFLATRPELVEIAKKEKRLVLVIGSDGVQRALDLFNRSRSLELITGA